MTFSPKRWLTALACTAAGTVCSTSSAGIVYQFLQDQSTPGAPLVLQGVMFNDTGSALSVDTPDTLELQWRGADGRVRKSTFQLTSHGDPIELPVNNFIKLEWTGQPPAAARGTQSVTIADSPVKLAFIIAPSAAVAAGLRPTADEMGESRAPATQEAADSAQGSPFENFRKAISGYEPVYFIAGRRDGVDARFQLSLKYRLHSPKDPAQPGFWDHFYIGYTQTSLWDLDSDSNPFVDTTYNPSVFWNKDSIWQTPDQKWFIGMNAGVEHRSNGKDDEDSRSLNDFYIQPAFNYRLSGGSTLSFMPRVKAYIDTHKDYGHYLGHVEWKARWAQDNGLAITGLYRQGAAGHHATQVDLSWPLRRTPLGMNGYLYLQMFQGYGETLLGFREKSSPQVRLGIAFVP
jgi:outer membrane phospholipase A